jgi:hypothetical protein
MGLSLAGLEHFHPLAAEHMAGQTHWADKNVRLASFGNTVNVFPISLISLCIFNTETVEILRSSSMYCGFSSLFTPLNTSLSVP